MSAEPSPLPPPHTGDPALDADLLGLDRPTAEANAVADRVRRLSADPRPLVRDAILSRVEALAAEVPQSIKAAQHRGWVAQSHLQVLESTLDDRGRQRLVALLDDRPDPQIRPRIADFLLRTLPPQRRPWLEKLAAFLSADHPLAPFAAQARFLLEGDAAKGAIADVLRRSEPYTRSMIAVRVSAQLDFDAAPDWVDALCPAVIDLPAAIALTYRFHAVKRAEPLLRALRCSQSENLWVDFLDRLREIGDPTSADEIERLAAEAKVSDRIQRSARKVAKALRQRKPGLRIEDAIGTEGGPILLLPAEAAAAWRGGPDYERACAAVNKGTTAAIDVAARKALVLPMPAVGVGHRDGAIFLVMVGNALELEEALAKPKAWKRMKSTLTVAAGGLLLLDATAAGSTPGPEESYALPAAPGVYEVSEIVKPVHAVRLTPTRPT